MITKAPNRLFVKESVEQLAIFNDLPAFSESVHVGRPNIGDRKKLLERIEDLLDRRWLTNDGPYVRELEQLIAERVGVKHCIATCNATIALELTIRALGMTGEVIIPSFTFIATAHALQWQEITPVFCDIDHLSHNIDPAQIETLIGPRTTGIIGVHVWGRACDIEALNEIARSRGLHLIFDAAHAFDCSYKGQMIGGFGDAEVFSFHATKFLNTFEGGSVVTNNDALAEKLRLMRNFGFHGYDNVIYIGTNGKMSEVSAAMGLTSLETIDEFTAINFRNYQQYRQELDGLSGVQLVQYDEQEKNNYQYVILEVDEHSSGLDRDMLIETLHAENILARRYFYPGCHHMEPYRSLYPDAWRNLPATERLTHSVVALPNGTAVDSVDISSICQIIRLSISNASLIRERLSNAEGPKTRKKAGNGQ